MEIQARYTLIGAFILAATAAAFGFVYWLNVTGGIGQRNVFQARFDNSVSGLLKGSAVLFNGIRVGEVTDLQLDAESPKAVTVVLAVEQRAPVRADTKVAIEFQGLTGAPVVSLRGGAASALPAPSADGNPPVLFAEPDAGQSMTEAARSVLRNIDGVVNDNAEPLRTMIANISSFSAALARNSGRVDGIMSGIERLTGGGAQKSPARIYPLTAARSLPPIAKIPLGQLMIPEPTALSVFDSDKLLVSAATSQTAAVTSAQWPDVLPRVVQARIIESFEHAKYPNVVGRPIDGLKVDNQLLIDIRRFEIAVATNSTAEVELAARIVSEDGKILGVKIFKASLPAESFDASNAASALNEAFGLVAAELVTWTCATI